MVVHCSGQEPSAHRLAKANVGVPDPVPGGFDRGVWLQQDCPVRIAHHIEGVRQYERERASLAAGQDPFDVNKLNRQSPLPGKTSRRTTPRKAGRGLKVASGTGAATFARWLHLQLRQLLLRQSLNLAADPH